MRKLIVILFFILSSCAGSNFAVKQNELAKRYAGGPKQVIIKGKHK